MDCSSTRHVSAMRKRSRQSVAVRTQFNRNSCQGFRSEKSQTELECSRSVVLISKFVLLCCYVRVPTPAAMAASRKAFHHKAMRRPEDRRIFTIGQDE